MRKHFGTQLFAQLFTTIKNWLISPAYAQVELDQYLRVGGGTVAEKYQTPADLVNLLVPNLFIVAGLIVFFLIIGAGFSYIKDSSGNKEEAKNLATGAVVGFVVMFSAYWIIQIIEAVTGTDIPI
ncbi:MAG: hypothetical protein GF381_03540 [Candidatus Pacebacteria bacterium]|nr:hypothetical protein [Candidatus Paceibacterota bacterium]